MRAAEIWPSKPEVYILFTLPLGGRAGIFEPMGAEKYVRKTRRPSQSEKSREEISRKTKVNLKENS
jgi:hypothetical protein